MPHLHSATPQFLPYYTEKKGGENKGFPFTQGGGHSFSITNPFPPIKSLHSFSLLRFFSLLNRFPGAPAMNIPPPDFV